MDFAAFKKAFGIVDGSMQFDRILELTESELSKAWNEVGKIPVEATRAALGVELRALETQAGMAAAIGRSRPREAIDGLGEVRGNVVKLVLRADAAQKVTALDRDSADGLALSQEVLDWRDAIDGDVQAADDIDGDLTDTLRELVGKFDDEYRNVGVDERDHRAGRALVRAIETTATRVLVQDRDRKEALKRVSLLEQELFDAMATIESGLQNDEYGAPPIGALGVAVQAYVDARDLWLEARKLDAPTYTEETLVELAEAIDALDKEIRKHLGDESEPVTTNTVLRGQIEASDYDARKRYLALWEQVHDQFEYVSLANPSPLPQPLQAPFQKARVAHFGALHQKRLDYPAALAALEAAIEIIQKGEQQVGAIQRPPRPEQDNRSDEDKLKAAKEKRKTLLKQVKIFDKALKTDIRKLLGDLVATYKSERDGAKRDWKAALKKPVSIDGADAANTRLETALSDIEQVARNLGNARIREMEDDGVSPKLLLAEAERWATLSPDILRGLQPETLDSLAEEVGPKAKKGNRREVMRAAIIARYGLEDFTGDMTAKALPKFYKVMGEVPEHHTTTNPSLKHLVRNRKVEASWYSDGEDEIVMNMPRSWMIAPGVGLFKALGKLQGERFGQDDEVDPDFKCKPVQGSEFFDHTMLHEIGHAVDWEQKYMDKRLGDDVYGGWKTVSIDQVAHELAEHKGFYRDFPTVDRSLLDLFLVKRLEGVKKPETKMTGRDEVAVPGDRLTDRDTLLNNPHLQRAERMQVKLMDDGWPEEVRRSICDEIQRAVDPRFQTARNPAWQVTYMLLPVDESQVVSLAEAVTRLLGSSLTRTRVARPDEPAAGVSWKDLRDHAASKLADKLRKSGDDGLWDKGRRGASAANLGGRVYQQAYDKQWVSYAFSARNQGVSSYQFRAEGEWFAEAYAFFYLGRLPQPHPMYDWLTAQRQPTD